MGVQVIYSVKDAQALIPNFKVVTETETTLEFDPYALDCTPIERTVTTSECFAGEMGMGFVSALDADKAWFDNKDSNDELVAILERYNVTYYRV